MGVLEQINVGIVGACGRGASFRSACDALECVNIRAVCDVNTEALPGAAETLGADEMYTHYEEMLAQSDLDAVIIGTPMQFHAPQAILALNQNIHVLSEVTAGVSVDVCRKLVEAEKVSQATYMMAENFTYMKPNVLLREIVRRGLLGVPYYAEGEYLHELKDLNEKTVWRRRWQTGVAGVTYGTHSLGPILQWMDGDRVIRVCCAGSGHHYRDPRNDIYENDDSTVMLCQMARGGLVKIRVDMLSDRPHSMANYQLQGTGGCYESARAPGEKHRIWLKSQAADTHTWIDLSELEEEFLPDMWRHASETAKKAGHGGGDYFEICDFVESVQGKRPPEIGIHEAMDMTMPGLMSQESMLHGGAWMDVPDSRTW